MLKKLKGWFFKPQQKQVSREAIKSEIDEIYKTLCWGFLIVPEQTRFVRHFRDYCQGIAIPDFVYDQFEEMFQIDNVVRSMRRHLVYRLMLILNDIPVYEIRRYETNPVVRKEIDNYLSAPIQNSK